MISPAAAVFEIEPAKVLHGAAARIGVVADSDTQVRVAWALAEAGRATATRNATRINLIGLFPSVGKQRVAVLAALVRELGDRGHPVVVVAFQLPELGADPTAGPLTE